LGFTDFFRRKAAPDQANEHAHASLSMVPRPDLMEAILTGIVGILEINLALMSKPGGTIPIPAGQRGLRSRGYLVGLAEAILAEFAALNPTEDEFIYAMASSFAAAHGPCDGMIGLETCELFKSGNQDVADGVALAHSDVRSVYSGEAWAAPNGFWLIHRGEEVDIRHNLSVLKRL